MGSFFSRNKTKKFRINFLSIDNNDYSDSDIQISDKNVKVIKNGEVLIDTEKEDVFVEIRNSCLFTCRYKFGIIFQFQIQDEDNCSDFKGLLNTYKYSHEFAQTGWKTYEEDWPIENNVVGSGYTRHYKRKQTRCRRRKSRRKQLLVIK